VLTFLGVHADHRLVRALMVGDLLVEILKLGVPIRVLIAFDGLGVGLQTESLPDQQLAHRRRRDPMPLPGQLLSQVP